MHYAVEAGDLDVVQEIVKYCGASALQSQNHRLQTPLHTAVKHGNVEITKSVLTTMN